MGKSRSKDFSRSNQWDDYDDGDYGDYRDTERRRKEKRMKNLIRSKNVDQLMDMDEEEVNWNRR
ncbi:hypothetical protein UFOVP395_128 [uncultured Caudovirales phage]|jgi:hypothetical protein|uniref:Uncharacterized protein n=1 Tax=uncultured Caudovirales phage TaxID=2100421 RepID=A0A6J5M5L1_9CAUD|nr:hypothetical protein UFOVP395_128 [uncultured Caudovirales phage]